MNWRHSREDLWESLASLSALKGHWQQCLDQRLPGVSRALNFLLWRVLGVFWTASQGMSVTGALLWCPAFLTGGPSTGIAGWWWGGCQSGVWSLICLPLWHWTAVQKNKKQPFTNCWFPLVWGNWQLFPIHSFPSRSINSHIQLWLSLRVNGFGGMHPMKQILGVPMFQSHTAGMEAPDEWPGCLMSALLELFCFLVFVWV